MTEEMGAMPKPKPLTVPLSPASEQLMKALDLTEYPEFIQRHIAVALLCHQRESMIRDLRTGREVAPAVVNALNALNREVHAHHNVFAYQPWHDYRIINCYLCSGHKTDRGTAVWLASGELIPVLEDLPQT